MNYQLQTSVCLKKIILYVPFPAISFYMRIINFNKSSCNSSFRITWKRFYICISQAHYPMAAIRENSPSPVVAPWRNIPGTGLYSPVGSTSRERGVPCSLSFPGTGHTCRKCSQTGAHLGRIFFTWYFGPHLTPKGSQHEILDVI